MQSLLYLLIGPEHSKQNGASRRKYLPHFPTIKICRGSARTLSACMAQYMTVGLVIKKLAYGGARSTESLEIGMFH